MKSTPLNLELFEWPDLLKGWDIRLSPRFWSYTPQFEVFIETPQYILKTARSMSDLLEVFQLRHRIFLENTQGGGSEDGFDLDEFDDQCDHIIIQHKETQRICGTYRLLGSARASSFYSETEFNLDAFLAAPGEKLELGRACIDYAHRNGAVIDLLWRGLGAYANALGVRYLFGCSSVKTLDLRAVRALFEQLKEDQLLSDRYGVRSTGKFAVDFTDAPEEPVHREEVKGLLPPLLRSYFSAGAKVYGWPALDRDFECFDFLTILDLHEISPSFRRRYFTQK